jgi:hypothetical protein
MVKSEIRNSKFEGRLKAEVRRGGLNNSSRSAIRISSFGFLSDFEFRISMLGLALCFAAARPAWPQQRQPHIGYVYPAGGRQGATFPAIVGGQFLDGVTNAFVSGPGVRAVVVEFNKPMNPGMFNQLRDQMRQLQERRQAALRDERRGVKNSTNVWTAAEERKLEEIRAKILKNPPNRNATPALVEVATLKVTVAADAPPGPREIRLGTPLGLTNPLKFYVGQLPEFSDPPARPANPDVDRFRARLGRQPAPPPKTEPRVTLPATLNGQIMPGEVDRFRFTARKGQQLVIAASARELIPYLADAVPGWFQATLTLYDAQGRELAYDDDYRFHPDPVLHYVIPQDGDYVLEIKDAIYRGREDFVYRITAGELPFVTSIFPLGGPDTAPTTVALKGWNLPTTRLTVEARDAGPSVQTIVVTNEGRLSNRLPFAVDNLPECLETEPKNTPDTAQTVTLPVIVNGRIGRSGDVDVFRFNGRAGDRIVAEVYARRLDSPLDSALRLTDARGRQLAFNDDHEDKGSGLNTHHADSYLLATLPADGTYFVHLNDVQHQGGDAYGYRLRLGPPRPDFALRVVPSSVSARAGASATLTAYALRKDGFTNDIIVFLSDAPDGFKLSGGKISGTNDQVRLTLTVPFAPQKKPVRLGLAGRAILDGDTVIRPAVPAEDMMQAFAYRHLVPSENLEVAILERGRFAGPFRNAGRPALKPPPAKPNKTK